MPLPDTWAKIDAPSTNVNPDQRREGRLNCDIACVASSVAGSFAIRIINVSMSGFGFTSQTILPHSVETHIILDSGPLAGLSGTVRWVSAKTYGVEFFPRDQNSQQVRQFLLAKGFPTGSA